MAITPLNQGGTGADLSATGGANEFVKQTSAGATLSVATITTADITSVGIVKNPTAAQTIAGKGLTLTNSAPLTVAQVESVQYVDSTLSRGGTDIGDEINKAYAVLAASSQSGGKIIVAEGNYSYNTPIAITSAFGDNNNVTLEGAGRASTVLNYLPTTGTAITVNQTQGFPSGVVIRDIWFQGPGYTTSTVGLQLGGTIGAAGATVDNVNIRSFGKNVQLGNLTYLTLFTQCDIEDATQALVWPDSTNTSGENLEFHHCAFSGNNSANTAGSEVYLGNNVGDIYFYSCSFDDAPLTLATPSVATLAHVVLEGCHIENPSRSTTVPVTNNGQNLTLRSCVFEQDTPTTPAYNEFIAAAGGVTLVDGCNFFNNASPNNVPQAVLITGTGTRLTMTNTESLFRVTSAYTDSGTNSVISPGPTSQVFTGSGTFTIPANVIKVKVTVVGGGGAGGGASATNNGGGGGAGGCSLKWLSGLTSGNTLAVTVGAGGTGVSNATGNAGALSKVASGTQTITTIQANGGGGGFTAATNGPGGAGGTAGSGGDIDSGGNGGTTGSGGNGGAGGGSIFGGGGSVAGGGSVGNPATGPSGGGGGACIGATHAGGAGTGGIVIFEWS